MNGVIDQECEEEGVWPPGWAPEGRRGSDRSVCCGQSLGRTGGIGEWIRRDALRVATVLVLIGAAFALLATSAKADGPPPIKLTLSPAKLPTPALRYQLLPDARTTNSGDAAPL